MSVEISPARIATMNVRPQLFSGNQEAVLGGPSLPIPRAGDRFAADLSTTQMLQNSESLAMMADLFEASTADARILINQPHFERGYGYGTVVADGAGQAGSTLAVRGGNRTTVVSRGQLFSIIHAGAHFVYMAASTVIFGSDGKAAIPIWPMLRAITVDGEQVALDRPMIEGQLVGFDNGVSWSRNLTDAISFSIVERA